MSSSNRDMSLVSLAMLSLLSFPLSLSLSPCPPASLGHFHLHHPSTAPPTHLAQPISLHCIFALRPGARRFLQRGAQMPKCVAT